MESGNLSTRVSVSRIFLAVAIRQSKLHPGAFNPPRATPQKKRSKRRFQLRDHLPCARRCRNYFSACLTRYTGRFKKGARISEARNCFGKLVWDSSVHILLWVEFYTDRNRYKGAFSLNQIITIARYRKVSSILTQARDLCDIEFSPFISCSVEWKIDSFLDM